MHKLRHSYATRLLEVGVNLRFIQAYLGHNSPNTSAIHIHLTRDVDAPALEAMEQEHLF